MKCFKIYNKETILNNVFETTALARAGMVQFSSSSRGTATADTLHSTQDTYDRCNFKNVAEYNSISENLLMQALRY